MLHPRNIPGPDNSSRDYVRLEYVTECAYSVLGEQSELILGLRW